MMYVPQGSKCPKCGKELTISPPSVKKEADKGPRKIPVWLLILIIIASVVLVSATSILVWVSVTKEKAPAPPEADEVIAIEEESTEPAPILTDEEPSSPYEIGVVQLVQHDALDKATQGFVDVLTEKLGDEVIIDVLVAGGDSATCVTIANTFVARDVDLIMANSMPALQASSSTTGDIPILGTSITDYGVALGLDDFNGYTGINVSGTSDLAPLDQQVEMIVELFPETKKVALLYCDAEDNSKYQVTEVARYLTEKGIESKEYPFSDSTTLQMIAEEACTYADVIYVPTDNQVASNAALVDSVCRAQGVPVIAGESGICSTCGVATLSIDYYQLGRITGMMAYEVLVEGASVSEMPIRYDTSVKKLYNPEICEFYGIVLPEEYISLYDHTPSEESTEIVAE